MPATYGDIRQDCRTPRSRYKRTVEDREKQVIVLKGRWCIPLSGKTVRKASMDKIESKPMPHFKKGDAFVEKAAPSRFYGGKRGESPTELYQRKWR